MPVDDIRQFVEELEKAGQLKRIKTEVDANLEIAEILRRVSYTNGPAILFENVKGYEMPVLGNAFGSVKRLEIGLETTEFSEIGQRIADMTKMEIPSGLFNKIKKLLMLFIRLDIRQRKETISIKLFACIKAHSSPTLSQPFSLYQYQP